MTDRIFAIVVTYNGANWIERCFGSLTRSSILVNIIAIDNNSSDDTVKILRTKFPMVEVLETGKNLGFGKANNIGMRKAIAQNADFVFLLNQDAWIEKDAIGKLLEVMKTNSSFGILSPFHMNVMGTSLEKQFQEFLCVDIAGSFASDAFMQQLRPVYKTEYIHAACWLISKECLNKVGGFDPLFFHYGEDDDYMERTKYFGFDLGIVPTAKVTHDCNYNGWKEIEWDKNRNTVMAMKQLKKMSPHFRSNLLGYLKTEFDEMTSFLLFRKFRKFLFRFKVFWSVIFKLRQIRASYKSSFKTPAFLEHE